MLISSVVAFELWYGVTKSEHRAANAARLSAFLSGPLEWTPFDDEELEKPGSFGRSSNALEHQSARTTC